MSCIVRNLSTLKLRSLSFSSHNIPQSCEDHALGYLGSSFVPTSPPKYLLINSNTKENLFVGDPPNKFFDLMSLPSNRVCNDLSSNPSRSTL